MSDNAKLNAELSRLRQNGLVLPYHPQRAARQYASMVDTQRELSSAADRDLGKLSASLGRKITAANYDTPEVQRIMQHNAALTNAMGAGRGVGSRQGAIKARATKQDARWNQGFIPKTSMMGGGGSPLGGDVMNGIPRFYDPLEYWDLSGLPWNVADEGHRHKLHKWLRLYYATHYLVPILVDIFTRFPLVGLELESKDPALVDIYNDIFLDQLNYEDFLVGLGREFWLVGEAFPLASFDEDLGIWEHEELINPEDVVIDNFPLLDSQQLKIVPPDYLRRIAQTRSPAREWYMLQQQYEDLIPYLLKGEHIPISPVMLTQVANKLNNWDDHGTPILLRGLRTLLHEEKLLASQDAIAERLYSPFILAKLGIMDMGDGLPPWVPTSDELQSVRDDIDIAMASDFRVMVHHFGLEMTSVFGREQMPRLGDDFDRIERRLMQVFGINPSLLSAGSNSAPYASSALQAEFMNQILRTFQKTLKEHFKKRALVVAEAQGHYDYERKGSVRVPIYETVVDWDDEGNKIIRREKKLLVPDLNFACLAFGTRVSTPSGPVATETLQEGDQVIAWDLTTDKAVIETVTHSYDNGVTDVYRIRTKLGRQIDATAEHPFLTDEGWVEAASLGIQSKLRVGTEVGGFAIPQITERDARFLGLIVGDGGVSQSEQGAVPTMNNLDDEVLRWVNNYALGRGCSLTAHASLSGATSHTKRVPQAVWSGGPGVWAAFLSGYLDADGTVSADHHIAWDSRNKPLLQDCQDLLSFLGIRSSLYEFDMSNWPDPQGHCHDGLSYRLVVTSRESLNLCQGVLEPLCVRKQLISSRVQAVDARRALSKWDEIVDIEVISNTPTWSLGISGPHTHITEGLVTHNTFDLRDEATERQFVMSLRQAGLPIPDDKLMVGISWKNNDFITEYNRDIERKTISQQQAKMDTYIALVIKGLPVPMDLKYEVESVLQGGTGPTGAPGGDQGGGAPPGAEGGPGGPGPNTPPEEGAGGMIMPPPPPGLLGPDAGSTPPGGGPPPAAPGGIGAPGGGMGTVPQVSNERRQGLQYNTHVASLPEPVTSKYDLAERIETWPEEMQKRARAIYDSITLSGDYIPGALEKSTAIVEEVTGETDDPSTWEVKSNQTVIDHEGETVLHEANRKRLIMPIEASKKYSIIDGFAEPLE